jgi:hypothetical protein
MVARSCHFHPRLDYPLQGQTARRSGGHGGALAADVKKAELTAFKEVNKRGCLFLNIVD